jgi:hypothetical protein
MADRQRLPRRLAAYPTRARRRLAVTGAVARGVLRRRGSLVVFAAVTGGYLLAFLWLLGDMVVATEVGFSMFVVDDPLARSLRPAPGAFLFRPVALFELGVVVWEFSPLNTLLGAGIATLVGFNLAVSYLAVTQPRSCGLSTGAGLLASIPGLLAGSTCCAPVLLLVIGIQASGLVLAAFAWLLPVSVLLLVSTLVYVAGKIDLAAL